MMEYIGCEYCGQITTLEAMAFRRRREEKLREAFYKAYNERGQYTPEFYFYDIAHALWGERRRCSLVKGRYFLFHDAQRSSDWLKARSRRATASNFGTIMGVGYESPESWVESITTPRKKPSYSRILMERGNVDEEIVRKWLRKTLNNRFLKKHGPRTHYLAVDGVEVDRKERITIKEIGLAVPISDVRIGASVDGVVCLDREEIDEIIEIKCTTRPIRQEIKDYLEGEINGLITSPNYSQHIPQTHYAQIQGCMAILGARVCHYTVFSWATREVVSIPVNYSPSYWSNLRLAIDTQLKLAMPKIESDYRDKKLDIGRDECMKIVNWKHSEEQVQDAVDSATEEENLLVDIPTLVLPYEEN